MSRKRLTLFVCMLLLACMLPLALAAQTQGISVQDLIQKFAGKEAVFKDARNNYTYTQEVIVQTLDGTTVDGEFRETMDILYDDKGRRMEKVTFAPQSTLTRVGMTKEDFDDFRNRLPFVLTAQDLGQYDILYVGQQHVDELETYVFDVAPKKVDKNGGPRYF